MRRRGRLASRRAVRWALCLTWNVQPVVCVVVVVVLEMVCTPEGHEPAVELVAVHMVREKTAEVGADAPTICRGESTPVALTPWRGARLGKALTAQVELKSKSTVLRRARTQRGQAGGTKAAL